MLLTSCGHHAADLIDLSRTGARLKGGSFPLEGGLTFKVEKICVPAELVWINGDECAVEFDTPIAANEVARIRAVANFVQSIEGAA